MFNNTCIWERLRKSESPGWGRPHLEHHLCSGHRRRRRMVVVAGGGLGLTEEERVSHGDGKAGAC